MSIWRRCPTKKSTDYLAPTRLQATFPIGNELRVSQPSGHRVRRQTRAFETMARKRRSPRPPNHLPPAGIVGDVTGGGGGSREPYLRLRRNKGQLHFQGSRDSPPAGC